jgi:hypothetical protein
MSIYKEIEAARERLLEHFGDEVTIKGSSFADWVVYVLGHLSKAGACASKEHFRENMITAAAMAVLAIEAADKRQKEHG